MAKALNKQKELLPKTVQEYRSRLRQYLNFLATGKGISEQYREWLEKRVEILTKQLGKEAKDILEAFNVASLTAKGKT